MNYIAKDFEKVNNILTQYEKKLDLSVQISLDEFRHRHEMVWEEMKKMDLDIGFFFWYREMPGDGVYMTGYNPTLEKACAIIAPGKAPVLLVGPESGRLAKEVGLNLETRFCEAFSIPDEYYEGIECDILADIVANYVDRPIKRIGYMTGRDIVPCRIFDIMTTGVDPKAEIIDATAILQEMRYEKSEMEMRCMEQADIIAAAAVRAMLAVLKPGMRELQITAIGDFVIKALGGESYGAEAMATSGYRNRSIIGPATNKIIEEGDLVQLSSVPSYQGYKGVCRRSVVAGNRNAIQEKYFEILNHGYELAVAELKNVIENDLPNNLVDLAPRNYFTTVEIEGKNMKQYHFYSTCHGTGLTECLEKLVIHPYKKQFYGKNVGMMLDLGLYGHPNVDICGGCVESAFFKKGNKMLCFTDLPIDTQNLVGKGL